MRWALVWVCFGLGACAANGVPVEEPAPLAPLPLATAQDAQLVFFDLLETLAPPIRTIVVTLSHAPDGAIAPVTVFPGHGSMIVAGTAASLPTDGERFDLTVAFDGYAHPKHVPLSTVEGATPLLSLVLDSIPNAEHDPHGDIEGLFKGHIAAESGPLRAIDLTVTMSGLLFVHTDGSLGLEDFVMTGTMTSPALAQSYTNSYNPY